MARRNPTRLVVASAAPSDQPPPPRRTTAAALAAEIAELERDVEALEAALHDQDLSIIDGYIVTVWVDTSGAFVARCPTLHAVGHGASPDEAMSELRDAMEVAVEGRQANGSPIPEKDTIAKCLG